MISSCAKPMSQDQSPQDSPLTPPEAAGEFPSISPTAPRTPSNSITVGSGTVQPSLSMSTRMSTENPYGNCTWVQLHDALVEKEYELQCLNDSLCRLAVFELESKRKDEVITTLRRELAAFRKNSRDKDLSYVSMEEHLSACEGHLKEKMGEVKLLQKEVESVRNHLQLATRQTSSLQQELSQQSTTLSSQTEEIRRLQQQQRITSAQLSSARQESKEKQASVSSLQDRVKRLRASNQDLQKRLEASQAGEQKLAVSEQKVKAELEKLRSNAASTLQMQARQEVLEQELQKAKQRENTLACELGSVKQEMTCLCQKLLAAISPGGIERLTDSTPNGVLSAVTAMTDKLSQTKEELQTSTGQLEEMQQIHSTLCSSIEGLQECFVEFMNTDSDHDASVDIPSALKSSLAGLERLPSEESLDPLKESLGKCLESLQQLLNETLSKWVELTEHIRSSVANLEESQREEDPFKVVQQMAEVALSQSTESRQLKERLTQSEVEHTASLTKAVEKAREGEQERYQCQLKEMQEQFEAEKQAAVSEEQQKTTAALEELEDKQKILAEMESKLEERRLLEEKLERLEAELGALEVSNTEALHTADMERNTLKEQLMEDIAGYKEQSQQYALTIVALEEKLLSLMETSQQLERETKSLREQLSGTAARKEDTGPETSCVTAAEEQEGKSEETERRQMEQLVGVLRHQLALASKEAGAKETRIQQLEKDIATITSRMENLEAEMSEKHSQELEDLKVTLSEQEATIENQREEMEQLLRQKACELAAKEQQCKEVSEELEKANLKIDSQSRPIQQAESSAELIGVGQRCLGEKHNEVLDNQREAIRRLKHELQISAKPPVESHQATLNALSRVRKELLQMKDPTTRSQAEPELKHKLKAKNSDVTPDDCDMVELVRSTEQAYNSMVDAVCGSLPLDRPTEKKMPIYGDKFLRERILSQRQQFAEKVVKELELWKSGAFLGSDEEMQEDKQKDNETGIFGRQQSTILRGAHDITEDPIQTISHLETELAAMAEELEQQKHLNQALLRRQSFKVAQASEAARKPRHVCVFSD